MVMDETACVVCGEVDETVAAREVRRGYHANFCQRCHESSAAMEVLASET